MIIIPDFESRECRCDKHVDCPGRWSGLGVNVICSCSCHKKEVKTLASVCKPEANAIEESFTQEGTQENGLL
jgi:hypothetical protein